jgi:hypothetical protein
MSVVKRETEETLSLLKDTARKHTEAENSKGGEFVRLLFRCHGPKYLSPGLVILEASYGPSEQDSETTHLVMDVTVAVQALVHNSQVCIAGHRTKVRRIIIVLSVFLYVMRHHSQVYRVSTTLPLQCPSLYEFAIPFEVKCTTQRFRIMSLLFFH